MPSHFAGGGPRRRGRIYPLAAAFALALCALPGAAQAQKRVTAILVPGEGGASASDFLIRNRPALEQRGIATVVAEHGIADAVARAQRPVVVVAMSRGALAAAGGAARADGLVLVSAPLVPGPRSMSVQGVAVSPSALPMTLVVHNPQDACPSTPPTGVVPFQGWAAGKVQVAWIRSGPGQGNPCGPFAAHGFAGNDAAAVAAIAAFILTR